MTTSKQLCWMVDSGCFDFTPDQPPTIELKLRCAGPEHEGAPYTVPQSTIDAILDACGFVQFSSDEMPVLKNQHLKLAEAETEEADDDE